MMYEYMELPDQTLITHSQLIEKDGQKTVQVHFERPKAGGFDMARCELPSYVWLKRDGFSDEEIEKFTEKYGRRLPEAGQNIGQYLQPC